MERYAWTGMVLPGKTEEYKKRHDEIWPEMKEMFRKAGIRNYSIWMCGNQLFGYYECESIEYASKVQRECPTSARWKAYMADVIQIKPDPATGTQPKLEQVFLFDNQ